MYAVPSQSIWETKCLQHLKMNTVSAKISVTKSKTVSSVVFHKKEREKFDRGGTGLLLEDSKIKRGRRKREEEEEEDRPWDSKG